MTYPSNLHLRVLYTINSSPQYILARSRLAVPVNLIQEPLLDAKQRSTRPKYATVSLKACLDTICRSSPELVQDNNRDYSVYVLDPLESNSVPAPMNISNSSMSTRAQDKKPEDPCGVAVGLGLMSWALHANENESAFVTGTQVQLSTGQEALEVIFALRETAAMQRASLSTALQSWGLPIGMSSPTTQLAVSTSSATVNPRALSLTDLSMKQHGECASTDDTTPVASHPQVTHSHRRSKNLALNQVRNKAKSRSKKVSKPSTAPSTQSDKLMYASETYIGPLKKKGRPKNSTATVEISKHLLAENDDGNGIQGTMSSLGVEPIIQSLPPSNSVMEDTLVQPLETDVSTEDAHSHSSLLDFLASLSNLNAPSVQNANLLAVLSMIDASTTVQSATTNQEPSPALIDALKQLLSGCASQPSQNAGIQPSETVHPSHASVLNQDEDVIILDKENVDPLAFRRRGDKDSTGDNATIPTESSNHIYNVLGQKNEQMNSTATRRKRTLSDFMDERESERNKQRERDRSDRREINRRARKLSGSSSTHDGNSNGLRHYPRLVVDALPRPGMNSYYRVPLETRSSPPRPRVDANVNCHAFLSRRTDAMLSASSPSRSNSMAPLRKPYVVPEWARTNTTTQPRLSEDAQQALAEAEEKKKKEREASRRKSSLSYRRLKQETRSDLKAKSTLVQPSSKAGLPPPVAANNSCPVFPASDASDDVFLSSSQSITEPTSPQSSSSTAPIPQTPPQKRSMPLFTPDEGSGSLFTPTPRTRHTRNPEYSPSPSTRSKLSPIQAVVAGRGIGGADGWSGKTAEHGPCWDDVDGPPSSLPTASDGEDDTPTCSALDTDAQVINLRTGRGEQEHCVRQHWVGLPPSSPPPSSPALTPQDDEDTELTDLPVPTSDIEGCTTFQGQPESDGDTEFARDVFDPPLPALSSDGPMPTDLDDFTQLYSDFRSQKENHPTLESSLESIFQNGLVDFDFTEFWESFKPMVEDYSRTDSNKLDSSKHVDHMGLAEDMQSLFGGCLM